MVVKADYKISDVGMLPRDWEVIKLKNCCMKITDGTHDTPKPIPYGIPYLTAINIKDNWIDFESCLYIEESVHRKIYDRCNPQKGDVLFVNIGAGVAKSALVTVDYEFSLKNVALLKPNDYKINGGYLNASIKSKKQSIVKNLSSGGAQPFLSLFQIGEISIPVPPTLNEQKAIAEVLRDTDAFIESLEKLITKKRLIKQGVMQELLTGKRRLSGENGRWELVPFGEIAEPRKERFNPCLSEIQLPCVELENLEEGSGQLLGFSMTKSNSSLKSKYKKGDVLFGKLRAYLKKYWIADNDGICSTEIWPLIANPKKISPHYLFQLIQMKQFLEIASITYGTHMPRSDWKVIKDYQIYLPDIPEQNAITNILSDIDSNIYLLDEKRKLLHYLKQGLMQALLTGRIRLV
jgi:type I restriction enzyme, S subunit